jgi:hypothetical protein
MQLYTHVYVGVGTTTYIGSALNNYDFGELYCSMKYTDI